MDGKPLRITRGLLMVCFLMTIASFTAYGQTLDAISSEDLFSMSLEDLLNREVVTAGRKAQKISEAPATMTVITAEDIKQSGATQIVEALTMVPGLQLGYTSSNLMVAGGIRGFNRLPSNKIILLIDGIPWSFEVYGTAMFMLMPISLNEIERIEVLRGAGSSLYGANAVFGVINIITKKTEDTKGNFLSMSGGEFNTYKTDYINGGAVNNNFNYRLSLGWEQRDNWDYIAYAHDPVQALGRINTLFDYRPDDNAQINLALSYLHAKDLFAPLETTGPIDYSGTNIYSGSLSYLLKDPAITIRTFFNDRDMWDRGYSLGSRLLYFKMGTMGIEAQHSFEAGEKDSVVWGMNLNQEYAQGPTLNGKHLHNLYGTFVDNTYNLREDVAINTGLRFDHHPNTGHSLSYRVVTIWEPYTNHTLRFNLASAFRNPDFIEMYYDVKVPTENNMYLYVFGREENNPEKSTQYELSYTGQLSNKLACGLHFFYTEIEDFILFAQSGSPYVDPATGLLLIPYPQHNIGDARQYGTEAELIYHFTNNIKGEINYTHLEQWEKDSAVKQLLTMTPQHMLNAQIRAKFLKKWTTNFSIHYRSSTTWRYNSWISPEGTTNVGGKAQSYLIANIRIGYNFKLSNNEGEVALSVFNLLDKKYDTYPISTSDIQRRIMGTVTYKF